MIEVNGKTRTCGLIGNPVEHTYSPVIHNSISEMLEINMTYVPFHVATGELENAVRGAYALNILGCNVTVPYKNDVIPFLKDIDPLAAKIGAVNTLVRVDGGYKGYNTDMSGLLKALYSDGVVLEGEQVIILGAGGVGRAVAFMCAANGARKVYLLNRSVDKAKDVADEINAALETDVVSYAALVDYMTLPKGKYLVIQSTSVGMHPNVEDVVIEDEAFYDMVKVGYDLIFNPWETMFMQLCKAHGAQAYNGLKMLLYQGIDAYELWNNCKIDDEVADMTYEILVKAARK